MCRPAVGFYFVFHMSLVHDSIIGLHIPKSVTFHISITHAVFEFS